MLHATVVLKKSIKYRVVLIYVWNEVSYQTFKLLKSVEFKKYIFKF